jgi:hypothetical protein
MARLKPETLEIGMKFRLTGDACNEEERNDNHIYEVINKDEVCRLGAHVIVKNEEGKEQEMRIMPWVPLHEVING